MFIYVLGLNDIDIEALYIDDFKIFIEYYAYTMK